MDSYVQVVQLVYLFTSLLYEWQGRDDYFAATTMTVFYPNPEAPSSATGRSRWRKHVFKGPDFFVVLGQIRHQPRRRSWVVEYEGGKYPDVIVEVLSRKTKKNDLTKKKDIYEQIFVTYEYFVFDPDKETLTGFRLVDGRYTLIAPNEHGHLWSEKLELGLGLHYMERVEGKMVRFFRADGTMVLLPEEDAAREREKGKLLQARAVWEHEEREFAEAKAAQEREERQLAEAKAAQEREVRELAEVKAAQEREERQLAEAKAAQEREERQLAEVKAAQEREERQLAEAKAAREREERQLAEARAAKLAAMLKELGIDPDKI